MTSLDDLREQAGRLYLWFLWGHLIVLPGIGLILGVHFFKALIVMAVFSAMTHGVYALYGNGTAYRYTAGIAIMGIIAAAVFMLRGHPWQIDMHLYFFAALAILVFFIDRTVIVAAAVFVLVHHLVFNFVLPNWIYPDGTDTLRVVFHAIFVVVQTAALWAMISWLENLFTRSEEARLSARREADRADIQAAEALIREQEAQEASERALAAVCEAQERAEEARKAQNQQASVEEALVSLATSIEGELDRLIGVISKDTGDSLEAASLLQESVRSVGQNSAEASQAVRQAQNSTETIASAAEDFRASIHEIQNQSRVTDEKVRMAMRTMSETQSTVRGLNEAASKIQAMVGLIDAIASQTNLLALNATIEAARAGEAGRGFAVVAGEVKSLASQTAKSTQEITSFVQEMIEVAEKAATAIAMIGGQVEEVSTSSASITAAAEQQGAVTDDIARTIADAHSAVLELGHQIQEVTKGVDGNRTLSVTVMEKANQIDHDVKALKVRLTEKLHRAVAETRQEKTISAI